MQMASKIRDHSARTHATHFPGSYSIILKGQNCAKTCSTESGWRTSRTSPLVLMAPTHRQIYDAGAEDQHLWEQTGKTKI